MDTKEIIKTPASDSLQNIQFSDLFDVGELQNLQDLFAEAHGVASVITHPDGSPITNPSNFTRFCKDIIRETAKGCENCYHSDAVLGRHNPSGAVVQPCLSGGLWDAGASITVDGKHVANWLIGQVRNEAVDEQAMLKYAEKIGADQGEFMKALNEVPVMTDDQFNKVSKMLFAFANELSAKAYANWQLKLQIADRDRAATLLKESEEKLSALFGSMTEMVVLHEMIFNDEGETINYKITDCNQAFTEITGIKKEEAVGKLATEVYQTEYAPYLEEYSRVVISGNPHEYTTYFAPMDKHFMISAVSPSKNQFATISTDITDMKQISEMISAKNKELENYLYIASHDLRSPLVNIQGFSLRLQKQADTIHTLLDNCAIDIATRSGIDKITKVDIPKTLNFIFSNVTKMDTLINALLQISRTGQMIMTIHKVDMNKLFKTILLTYNYQITELSARVVLNELPDCYGDENQLNQLFSNIIGNAIKYSDPNRQLALEITSSINYNKVIYCIKDTGIGIAARHLERIWEVFYQVDPGVSAGGEGIGLSLAKRIADKHKGKIWVESEQGKGSAFYIELQQHEFTE